MVTQLEIAREGKISDAMKCVGQQENISAEVVRKEVAAGRLVIPANTVHLADNLVPAGIGRVCRTKINANIGASPVSSCMEQEQHKLDWAVERRRKCRSSVPVIIPSEIGSVAIRLFYSSAGCRIIKAVFFPPRPKTKYVVLLRISAVAK